VPEQGRRRSFTAQYKLEVLAAYDAAEPGEKGEILRREGLYSSYIVGWRRARDAGALASLARPRGRPATDPRDAQIARLRKEKARLEQELARARFVVKVQAKLQALLEALFEKADTEPRSMSLPARPWPRWRRGSVPGQPALPWAKRGPAITAGTAAAARGAQLSKSQPTATCAA
jgi:transposase-like protein